MSGLLLNETLAAFTQSINQHLPASSYQDFHQWALSDDNPDQAEWIQILGIPQLIKLTATLIPENKLHQILPAAGAMNAYQLYEIISDNLAINLADYAEHAPNPHQAELLYQFNQQMSEMLLHDTEIDSAALRSLSSYVSYFEQSLTSAEIYDTARTFMQMARPPYPMEALDESIWVGLVGNLKSCEALLDHVDDEDLRVYLKQSLALRYQSVSQLISNEVMNQEDILYYSTHAILVIPTIAFYIANLIPAEKLHNLGLQNLHTLLYNAALLIRLLNDVGTQLLTSREQRQAMIEELENAAAEANTTSLYEAIIAASARNSAFTRLHKDVAYGEWNVSLHNIDKNDPLDVAIDKLYNNIEDFAHIYKHTYAVFNEQLDYVAEQLKSNLVYQLIGGFVSFHEKVYSYHFETDAGEYAIAS